MYREIWNLAIHTIDKDGTLSELPSKHVDIGMGLERI